MNHEQFDHCSVLKLIENRWGLTPLTVRDANANDLADVLDFDHPNFDPPPVMNVPQGPFGGPCQTLQIILQNDGSVLVTWDATCKALQLEVSSDPSAHWTTVVTATESPYIVKPGLIGNYYRLVKK